MVVSTRSPLGHAENLESILDALHEDAASKAPEFWSMRVFEGLSQLCRGVTASLYGGADLDGQRTTSKSLLVEIRDLLDQLWWADWPAISSGFEREIREMLDRVREDESFKPPAPRSHVPPRGSPN